jgi:hypothetical protein
VTRKFAGRAIAQMSAKTRAGGDPASLSW